MSTTDDTAPGAPPLPAGRRIPVVDITATIRDLRIEAARMRLTATALEQTAAVQRRQADYLDALSATLTGHP